MGCKFIPAEETWAAFQVARGADSVETGGGNEESAAKVAGMEAQRIFMDPLQRSRPSEP